MKEKNWKTTCFKEGVTGNFAGGRDQRRKDSHHRGEGGIELKGTRPKTPGRIRRVAFLSIRGKDVWGGGSKKRVSHRRSRGMMKYFRRAARARLEGGGKKKPKGENQSANKENPSAEEGVL